MSPSKKFSRRKFLVRSAIGAGVMVGAGVIGCNPIRRFAATQVDEMDLTYDNSAPPTTWFEVLADNQLILHCPKVEMGQGVFTGLAQLAADELAVAPEMIRVVHARTDRGPVDPFSTGGSNSISSLWIPLRELAATLRVMLVHEAARIMGANPDNLSVENGMISGAGQTMTYGEVVAQATEWQVPDEPPALKPRGERTAIGRAIPRLDLLAKVKGEPLFGMDATFPGMLYGAIARPDKVDARLGEVDIRAAQEIPGVVRVVVEDDFVGVVANSKMAADQGKAALQINWQTKKVWQQSDIEEMIRVGSGHPVQIQKSGNARRRLRGAGVITAEYASPMGAHAQLEPNGALAWVDGDRIHIKMSTQVVGITRKEVAKRLGVKEEQVIIEPTYLGGGFGGRLHTPHAAQIAVLAKAAGQPVHCFFDRKEEFQNDTFRPPTHHLLKAKLAENGQIEAIEHNVSSGDVAFGTPLIPRIAEPLVGADFGAWRGGMIQYTGIPHYRAVSWRVRLPFATSWWRSLGLLANTFAIESFMDELAEKAGADPVAYRLSQIGDDARGRRLKGVIEAVAEKGNWGQAMPEGWAQGFACSTDANTPVAQIAEVSIEEGAIRVHKVTCAIDPGIAINPDSIRAQCEGAIIMGLSASLFEEMVIQDGSVQPIIYGPYEMALMRHAPQEIETIILENADKPTGVGEPPLGPIGAAVANAAYRLTGQRLRRMPLRLA